jgi:hypothetical protein
MTIHTAIKPADRTALPRALLGRRRVRKSEYRFAFEMGQCVTMLCTNEAAIIVGRAQLHGCRDEYLIELIDADCDPLWVQEHQIS